MSHNFDDMSDAGKIILIGMREKIAEFEVVMTWVPLGFVLKTVLTAPEEHLVGLLMPGPNEWDALNEFVKSQSGLFGVLRSRLQLIYFPVLANPSNYNKADKAVLGAFYKAATNS